MVSVDVILSFIMKNKKQNEGVCHKFPRLNLNKASGDLTVPDKPIRLRNEL